jgi:hypothetical protein
MKFLKVLKFYENFDFFFKKYIMSANQIAKKGQNFQNFTKISKFYKNEFLS